MAGSPWFLRADTTGQCQYLKNRRLKDCFHAGSRAAQDQMLDRVLRLLFFRQALQLNS
jgi:hypothetical protein